MQRFYLLPSAFCLVLGGTVALATAQVAPRTASMAGVILTDDAEGRPISRAVVTLTGAGLRPSVVAITDAEGRFAFNELPAGQFTVSATKPGYLTMAYGQATPGRGSGLPIALREGERVPALSWKLPRGGVITGRVLDERGQAMRDAWIVLMEYRTVNGERGLAQARCCGWVKTDRDGTYRVRDVLPGDYLVSAIPPGQYVYIPEPWRPNDAPARETSPEEVAWATEQVGAATRPGAVATTTEPPLGPTVAYGRSFYPGTPEAARATTITIGRGEERRGIDFPMRLERTATVEGRLVGPDGQTPARTSLSFTGATMSGPNPTGTFAFRNLLPGRYTIVGRAPDAALWGELQVEVNGQDRSGLVMTLAPSPSIEGRIVFDATTLTPPVDTTGVRLTSRPIMPARPSINAAADATFRIPGLDPGRYRLSATLTAPGAGNAGPTPVAGWSVKSIMLNGRDLADVPIELKPGERVTDVVITFTDRVSELSGTLLDAAGRPAPGYSVVLFSTDESAWMQGSRRVPAPVRAATDGRYRFTGLPAGSYYLSAVTSIDAADLADAALLKQLAASATTVTIAEGEKKTQDLKFATGR